MRSTRAIHLVGSLPPDITTPSEAMRFVLDAAGTHLDGLIPTGETNRGRLYIGPIVEGLAKHPALEQLTQGDWSTRAKRPTYRLRPGRTLREPALDPYLGYFKETEAAWPVFQQLLPEHPHLRLQVGIPSPFGLAFISFGLRRALRVLPYYRPIAEATAREISRIHALGGERAVFQLEMTAETLMAVTLPPGLRQLFVRRAARAVCDLVAALPQGLRVGLHLCYGSLNDRAAATPRSMARPVALVQAIARQWPAGRELDFVHVAMAQGQHPPLHKAYYAPLARLELPSQTRFIAGLAHERQPLDEQRRALGLVEEAVGHTVDVASACGLGRRADKAAALAAIHRAVELASLQGEPSNEVP